MRRSAIICIVILICVLIVGLSQTAVDPEDFTGEWYSAEDQSLYFFQEGLIYSSKHPIGLSAKEPISGAYSYCKNTIFLFAVGMDGLEKERELYLIQHNDSSYLCENEDGSGKTYFIRYNK